MENFCHPCLLYQLQATSKVLVRHFVFDVVFYILYHAKVLPVSSFSANLEQSFRGFISEGFILVKERFKPRSLEFAETLRKLISEYTFCELDLTGSFSRFSAVVPKMKRCVLDRF